MAGNTYGISEVVGTSETSIDDAIRGAITRASQTVRNLDWFEVLHVRGHIVDDKPGHFQVTLKLGFRIEE
jgi:flavin-binding protein dodecin